MWKVKYFDGEKAESVSALVQIQNNTLVIESLSGQIIDHWPLQDLSFDPNHLDRKFLMVRHEPRARLQILDADLVNQLPRHLHETKFYKWTHSKQFVAAGLIFIAVLAIFIFWGTKPLSKFIAHHISFETEKKIAEKISYDKFFNRCDIGITEQDLIEKLKSLSIKNPEFSKLIDQVNFVHMPQANAFTFPGGKIFITDKLVSEAQSFEELLGVIAHEVGHYKNRHVLQSVIRGSFLTLALNFFSGDISSFVLIDPATMARIIDLNFDRELEREADEYAVQALQSMNLGTNGLIRFFDQDKNDINQKIASKIPEFLSTHPPSQQRVEYLRAFEKDAPLNLLPDDLKYYVCQTLPK